MATARELQAAFSRGELSPLLYGRVDLETWRQGLRRCKNFIPLPQGVLTRRPGTRFVSVAGNAKLIPFSFSSSDSYILEFGAGYIKFYRDGQVLVDGGSSYTVATNYTADEVFELDYTQDGNILYLVHRNHKPRELVRSGHTSWTISDISFVAQPPEWSSGNWPQAVAFFEQRLVLASPPNYPNTRWLSKTPDPSNSDPRIKDFTIGTNPDDAIKYTNQGEVQEAVWLVEDRRLLIGMMLGVRSVGGSYQEPIKPTSIQIRAEGGHGCARINPVRSGNATLYVSFDRKRVYALGYDYRAEGWVAQNVLSFSEHISGDGIVDIAFSDAPQSVLWMARKDGILGALTWSPEDSVFAAHQHDIGGKVISIASIFENGRKTLYLNVMREINGSTVYYIEKLDSMFRDGDKRDCFFVDSGLSWQGESSNVISGLDHLEGETVGILADGTPQPSKVVVNGEITLDAAATIVQVGLHNSASIVSLESVWSDHEGVSRGKTRRPLKMTVDLYQSGPVSAGLSGEDGETLPQRSASTAFGVMESLYDGIVHIPLKGMDSLIPNVELKTPYPLPCTIRGMIVEVDRH